MLAAALGGRQLPRPEQLNVARRTLAFSLRGWHGIFASEDTAYIPDMSCQVSKRARHRQRQAETRGNASGRHSRPVLSAAPIAGRSGNGLRTFRVRVHMRRMDRGSAARTAAEFALNLSQARGRSAQAVASLHRQDAALRRLFLGGDDGVLMPSKTPRGKKTFARRPPKTSRVVGKRA